MKFQGYLEARLGEKYIREMEYRVNGGVVSVAPTTTHSTPRAAYLPPLHHHLTIADLSHDNEQRYTRRGGQRERASHSLTYCLVLRCPAVGWCNKGESDG